MSSGRDSKSYSPPSDDTMREVFTEGQSFTLPDDDGFKKIAAIRTSLSSYYETCRLPKQTPSSQSSSATESDAKSKPSMSGITTATTSEIESPVPHLPDKKESYKPLKLLPSHLDPNLPLTGYALGLMSDIKKAEEIKEGIVYLGEKKGHITYTVINLKRKIVSDKISMLKAPKPFNLVELNKLKNQILHIASNAGDIESASAKNAKLSLLKLPFLLFKVVLENLDVSTLNAANQSCREMHRFFQNKLNNTFQAKEPLLQKLLQYVVDANLDHAEEFIRWHYRFQLVTAEEKMPDPLEEDVIYIEKTGKDLKYSLTTSDGQCKVRDRRITLADLNAIKQSMPADEKDKKADQKIEIPADFTQEHLKALRPLILSITHKNKYTQPKNNRCLLTMKGEVGCDLYLMPDEKVIQDSDANHLYLYRKNDNLVYRFDGEEHTLKDEVLNVEIGKLFSIANLNKNGVLANNNLKWPQIQICKELLAETARRRHTSWVHSGHRIRGTALQIALGAEDVSRKTHPEEGMAEMIMRELRKLPDGETHIQHQIQAQFPEGWEAKEEKRHAEDLKALRKIKDAITASTDNRDPKLIAAVQELKEYLEPKGIIETGKHWNANLLQTALHIGYWEQLYDYHKDDFFYDQVIGSIDTHVPTNYAMAQAQRLTYLFHEDNPEKFNRSLKYRSDSRYSVGNYYPLSGHPKSRLGIHTFDCIGMGWCVRAATVFEKLVSSKNSSMAKLMQPYLSLPKASNCLVM